MLPVSKIIDGLSQCYGTEQYWKNKILNFQYTDGVKFLWESCDAYWLLIAISSYKRKEPFQVWELNVKEEKGNKSAVLTMKEDSDKPSLVKQEIEYTDFPLDSIRLYLIDGILLLTTEY
jgi:hypothetical protein